MKALLVLAASLLLVGSAHAQTPNNQISYQAITHAPVGSWADYVMSKEGEKETVKVRYTLVQRDAKQIVLEIDSKTPIGHMMMRLEFAPDGTRWKLGHAKMKVGDGDVRDMPVPADDKSSAFGKDDALGEKVGTELIETRGGKHSTVHYRRKAQGWNTEVWIDDKLFPVGLVKLVDGQGSQVELAGTGSGGKTGF